MSSQHAQTRSRIVLFNFFEALSVNGGGIPDEEEKRKPLPKAETQRVANIASTREFEISEKDEENPWQFFKAYDGVSNKTIHQIIQDRTFAQQS